MPMMMMIKRSAALVLTLLISYTALSQEKDFGIWYGATVQAGITQKITADVSGMIRTYNNASKVEEGFLDVGLEYKLNKYLALSGSYRYTRSIENDLEYHPKHKLFLDLKGNIKVSAFTFAGRLRFQSGYRTYLVYVEDKIPDYIARLKLKASYRTPVLPIDPYIYIETFLPLNKEPGKVIGKNRFAAGFEYTISTKHGIEAGYIFQRDYLPKLSDMNILSVGYIFKF